MKAAPDVPTELTVIYRDEHLIAVDKPSGLLSVPGRGEAKRDSLATWVQAEYPQATIVHRLDWDTSGVMLMALMPPTHREISRQFEQREVAKVYIAVVAGVVEEESGEICLPLAKDFERPPRHKVDHQQGREAITCWRVVQRHESRTRLELRPQTGRSHQLRIHLAEIGHPILGDNLYAAESTANLSDRLLLHAAELQLSHPFCGTDLVLSAPCPF